jgi:hypothetical protein
MLVLTQSTMGAGAHKLLVNSGSAHRLVVNTGSAHRLVVWQVEIGRIVDMLTR